MQNLLCLSLVGVFNLCVDHGVSLPVTMAFWLAALSAATALLTPASAVPHPPRAEDAALAFIDELVANLTEAAGGAESCSQEASRTVDVGYAKYEGYHDEDTDLNVWKG